MDFSEQQIKTLKNVVEQVVDDKFLLNNDLLFQEIRASEARTKAELRQEIRESEKRTTETITEFIGENVIPQIEDLDRRVTKLESKIA